MKRAFLYVSIGLTVLVIFTANSAVGAGWGLFYDPVWTEATKPWNIVWPNDGEVTSLGTSANPEGVIYVILDDFESGPGWDVRIHGYDVDNIPEQYEIYVGHWDGEPIDIMLIHERYYDTDGTVYFDYGNPDPPIICNMIVLHECLTVEPPPGGDWPGSEIDAVYARY